jgi:hypothetical protein
MYSKCFPKIVSLWDNVEKYGTARQAMHDNIMLHRKDVLPCRITKARNRHTHILSLSLIVFNTSCFINYWFRLNLHAQYTQNAMLLPLQNGYTNEPQYYVISALPILFIINKGIMIKYPDWIQTSSQVLHGFPRPSDQNRDSLFK